MKIQGAIFDLDGTLLDSMGVWRKVDKDFLGKRGLPVPEDYMERVGTMSFPDAARYTVDLFHLSDTPQDLMDEWMEMAAYAYSNTVDAKPGVLPFLQTLKARGVRLSVATASNEVLFIPALKRNGLWELFDAVTTLKEVKRGKGFPDIYEKAAEKLGLTAESCAVFEDHPMGVRGALSGGFLTVAVHDVYADKEEEELRGIADYYLKDFNDALADMDPLLSGAFRKAR